MSKSRIEKMTTKEIKKRRDELGAQLDVMDAIKEISKEQKSNTIEIRHHDFAIKIEKFKKLREAKLGRFL